MHLLYDCWIAWEAARVEVLHLSRELCHFLRGLRVARDHLTQLLEFAHALRKIAFGIRGISGCIRGGGLLMARLAVRVVAGINISPYGAIGSTAAGADVTTRTAAPLISEIATNTVSADLAGVAVGLLSK